jgi:hypothetical protein
MSLLSYPCGLVGVVVPSSLSGPITELLKVSHMMAQELEVAAKANEELHRLREGAEGREAKAEGKL